MAYDIRYPIGQFSTDDPVTPQILQESLLELNETPNYEKECVGDVFFFQAERKWNCR